MVSGLITRAINGISDATLAASTTAVPTRSPNRMPSCSLDRGDNRSSSLRITVSMVDIIDNRWRRVRDMPSSSQVSATEPDWSRERKAHLLAWDPAKSLLASLRAYQGHAATRGLFSSL